jgi:hypothetical protein
MRFAELIDGALEIRWTWLPYWIAINPALIREVEEEVFDAVKLNGATNSASDMNALHKLTCEAIGRRLPTFTGLSVFLEGLAQVRVGPD